MTGSITAIVLAAGQGSRFRAVADQDKLLAPCVGRDGVIRPMIEQVLVNLPPSVARRWVVTSPDRSEVIRLAQAYGCEVLLLRSAGMGDSIAAAVSASASATGWLVVLGDMPFILPSSIEQVVTGLGQDGISVPVQGGEYGHPVGFGRSFGPALMALTGDRGAKPLFAQALVREVPVDDPGVLWDVDVPGLLHFR
ncbi:MULTISPECIES: nucleotidyltransferase family protein [unclassified Pseudomonas]|uniref:nucleotidyltransferase family protein n=1 Tax=unclassified Pseudomonas TaxID=196821 RepID=UPI0011F091E8|nr:MULTISPECIES: nucleotidyltransferase family protein [unclassified Pseudomonas]KAA0944647.1 nucleotidyltransferase family protein [Pseudomonas sp. ANT_H4]KAA0951281.1 nucleotidyltransferase family protein [Pseudomonas sp. ANT_H14]